MSATTIDKLQIEIQSNAGSAAKGIERIADAMGKLKANGDISGAVKNLKDFANTLNGLKSIGSIGTLVSNLNKLPVALANLNRVKLDKRKFENLAQSLKPLEKIKAANFGGIATSLSRMADAVNKINGISNMNIKVFGSHLTNLADVLKKVAPQLSAVSAGMRSVGTASRSAGGGISEAGHNFFTFTQNAETIIHVLHSVAQALKAVIAQAIEWEGIAARFGRGFGPQAQETYDWVQRLNKEMGINVQQFMQYSSVYATMLTGFGVATEDASKMALGYAELTYDIWAGYNDIYKTYEDAADAVRSAISGEVEPVRRAGFTIIESTLQQTAANHGLKVSLETATEAQKSYLRYLTLVDQAHAQGLVGAYAKEMNTAEGMVRTFTQQLKSLAQAFGSLFLPILVKVMPYLQAFVELLTEAVHWVASLFGVEIQKVNFGGFSAGASGAADATDGFTESADDATKAVKALKNATTGIDELNIISPPSASSTGKNPDAGGGAGFESLPIDSLWDESIFDNLSQQVATLKQKIKALIPTKQELLDLLKKYGPVVSGISLAFRGWLMKLPDMIDKAKTKLVELGKKISPALSNIMITAGISLAVGKIVWDFTGAYLDTGNTADLYKALGATGLGAIAAGVLTGKWGAAGFVLAVSGIISLVKLGIEVNQGSVSLTDPQSIVTAVVGALETVLGGFVMIDALQKGKWTIAIGKAIGLGLKTVFTSGAIWSGLASAGSALVAGLAAIPVWGWVAAAVVAAIGGLIALGFADFDFTDAGYKLGLALGKAWKGIKDWAVEVDKKLTEAFKKLGEGIKNFFANIDWTEVIMSLFGINALKSIYEGLVELFTDFSWKDFFKKLGEGIKNFFVNFDWATFLVGLIGGPIAAGMFAIGKMILPGLWDGVKSWWNNLMGNIREWIDGFVKGWKDGLQIHSPSRIFKDIGGFLIEGLWLGITGWFNKLITNISKFVTDTIAKVKEFFGVGKTGGSSSKFKDIGGNLVQGVIDGITGKASALWTSLKGWADGVIKNIKGFFGIHSPSTVAKKEIGANLVSGMVQGVTEKATALVQPVKNMWDNAKRWWNEKKGAMATYTPNIGNISSKLSSAWSAAKKWWSSKGGLSFTPSIGSITNGLKTAWNAAKKWWNSNVKLSIPSLSLKVTYSNASGWKKAIVNALDLPGWPSLKFAANGGMFDMGSLIWAGERGAEIVANAAGGRTGVMNVEQMYQAVYDATYAAMMAAQAANGGGEQAVKVYLDGREITHSVERRQKERGKTLMGTQVYTY